MSDHKNKEVNPFSPKLSREKVQENLMFGLFRGMTYFVLFCAAFLFWDILSKGANKIFEGDGLINWEFLTEHPQTLHVIDEGDEEIKLSSSDYYKLKDEKIGAKWNLFAKSPEFGSKLSDLDNEMMELQKEWTDKSLRFSNAEFLIKERENLSIKFGFWSELLSDINASARDFEVEPQDVPVLVSEFILGHFEKERSRLPLVETKITFFRAQQYPNIEEPSLNVLKEIEKAYNTFLDKVPEAYNQAIKEFGNEVSLTYEGFNLSKGPKEFGRFAEALVAYETIRRSFLDIETKNWNSIQELVIPFKQAMSVSLPSRDYAYSGGGIFPAIIGTLLLVLGAMTIAIILGVFCAIFLAEYGKPGKFLSLIRLAILNLAGVPSIIYGLFGFGLFVIFLDWNVSLLAGWFTLAFMVLPIVITASEESLRSIPQGFREGSLALGATKWIMIKTSVLPFAMPGILTSSILGVARAAGETAPIMFTAAYAKRSELPWEGLEHWTDFFFQGVMALPYHIYVVSAKIPQNEYTADMQYGTAFVFLFLVIGVTGLSMLLRNRLRKKYRW